MPKHLSEEVASLIQLAQRVYGQVAPGQPFHGPYDDHEYGFPLRHANLLFERLTLEINQAGLSWLTILEKREGFRRVYHNFDLETVAAYGEEDRLRLLKDAGIIRNRLKINAAIENARCIVEIQKEYGPFAALMDHQHPLSKEEWVKLFKKMAR